MQTGGQLAVSKCKQVYQEGKAAADKSMTAAAGKGWQSVAGASHRPRGGHVQGKQPALPAPELPNLDSEAGLALVPGLQQAPVEAAAAEGAPTQAAAPLAQHSGPQGSPPSNIPSEAAPGSDAEACEAGQSSALGQAQAQGQGRDQGPVRRPSSKHLHLVEVSSGGTLRTTYITWGVLAAALYLGALPLVIIGTVSRQAWSGWQPGRVRQRALHADSKCTFMLAKSVR